MVRQVIGRPQLKIDRCIDFAGSNPYPPIEAAAPEWVRHAPTSRRSMKTLLIVLTLLALVYSAAEIYFSRAQTTIREASSAVHAGAEGAVVAQLIERAAAQTSKARLLLGGANQFIWPIIIVAIMAYRKQKTEAKKTSLVVTPQQIDR